MIIFKKHLNLKTLTKGNRPFFAFRLFRREPCADRLAPCFFLVSSTALNLLSFRLFSVQRMLRLQFRPGIENNKIYSENLVDPVKKDIPESDRINGDKRGFFFTTKSGRTTKKDNSK